MPRFAELADEQIDMADIGPPGSFVKLRPRQVFLFDKRLKRGRRNLLVFLFIRVLLDAARHIPAKRRDDLFIPEV